MVKSRYNASTFTPYDPADAIGDLNPTTPEPPVDANQKCGVFGQILTTVIAIAVTVATGGNAVLGNLASQAFGVITGIQEKFSWNSLAMSYVTMNVGNAVRGVAGAAKTIAGAAVRGAASSAISQGIGVATGLQDQFSWSGVAAAGVSAGVSFGVSNALPGKAYVDKAGNYNPATVENQIISHTAGAISNAATRSVVDGSNFGDNLIAAIPDVIGNAVGAAVGTAGGDGKIGIFDADSGVGKVLGGINTATNVVGNQTGAILDSAYRDIKRSLESPTEKQANQLSAHLRNSFVNAETGPVEGAYTIASKELVMGEVEYGDRSEIEISNLSNKELFKLAEKVIDARTAALTTSLNGDSSEPPNYAEMDPESVTEASRIYRKRRIQAQKEVIASLYNDTISLDDWHGAVGLMTRASRILSDGEISYPQNPWKERNVILNISRSENGAFNAQMMEAQYMPQTGNDFLLNVGAPITLAGLENVMAGSLFRISSASNLTSATRRGALLRSGNNSKFRPYNTRTIETETTVNTFPKSENIEIVIRGKGYDEKTNLLARFNRETGNLFIDNYTKGRTKVKGVGTELLSQAIETVGPNNVKNVSGQLWETNLQVYEMGTRASMTQNQALWATPIGQSMNTLGFGIADITSSGSRTYFKFGW